MGHGTLSLEWAETMKIALSTIVRTHQALLMSEINFIFHHAIT